MRNGEEVRRGSEEQIELTVGERGRIERERRRAGEDMDLLIVAHLRLQNLTMVLESR